MVQMEFLRLVLFLFNKPVITEIKPINNEPIITISKQIQPNQKQIIANSFASPKPILSLFFKIL